MNSKALNAKQALKDFKIQVDLVLKEILDKEVKEAENYTPLAVDYMTELRNIALTSGKRLRPSFVYYTYKLCGGNDEKEIMKIAAAIELIHVFLLVEDDFMDLATKRRGYPTINETYRKWHAKNLYKKDSTHFGNTIAVNVGLMCDHIAMNIVNNSKFDLKLIKKAQNQINNQIIITGHGQIHDMLNEVRSELTEEDIINVLYWKTGIYTYNNPIQVGAILAGATEKQLELLAEYAIPGGVAFQIQDDILGTFGDEESTGKSADGDIMEGKQTLLTFHAYNKASKNEKAIMDEVIGNPKATKKQVDEVRKIFVSTGALEISKNKALELVKEAKASLLKNKVKARWTKEGVEYLEGIADYMIEREL
jgi:geranylgeranyl diphosphate synthase, type I